MYVDDTLHLEQLVVRKLEVAMRLLEELPRGGGTPARARAPASATLDPIASGSRAVPRNSDGTVMIEDRGGSKLGHRSHHTT